MTPKTPNTPTGTIKWFWVIAILCFLFALVAGLVTGFFQFR